MMAYLRDRELRQMIFGLLKHALALALFVLTMVELYQGDYDRATFDLVLAIWLSHSE